MALSPEGMLRKGCTISVRNVRMIDRSQLRGRTMQTMNAGFRVFEGASPDYYDADPSVLNTNYNYGGNMASALTDVGNNISGPVVLWENGKLNKGPVTSGTLLLNPRAYYNPSTMDSESQVLVSGTIAIDATTEAQIGPVTIVIPESEGKNQVF